MRLSREYAAVLSARGSLTSWQHSMSKRSKSQRNELIRSREHDAQVASELQRERRVGEDLAWRGIGERVCQIREVSAFDHGFVWDIRRVAAEYKLYVSELNPSRPGFLIPGYRQLGIDSQRLNGLLLALASAKLSSCLPANPNIGLDGTTTSIAFSNGFASIAVSWWEEGPPEWSELTELARQAAQEFKRLKSAVVEVARSDDLRSSPDPEC